MGKRMDHLIHHLIKDNKRHVTSMREMYVCLFYSILKRYLRIMTSVLFSPHLIIVHCICVILMTVMCVCFIQVLLGK